jgi:NAD-dependent DNA ligase
VENQNTFVFHIKLVYYLVKSRRFEIAIINFGILARILCIFQVKDEKSVDKRVIENIENLRTKIRYHDGKYYVENMPEISDYEYDQLMKELEKLESAYPQLIIPDSPTQRVSGEPIPEFTTIEHRIPMLSIENTYSEEELREFDKRIREACEEE